jgi:hypothetical protein
MYLLKPGIKEDPVRRWHLPDRVFFAAGACHILAHAFLERFPWAGFGPVWMRPQTGFTGNHVFVTNGDLAFDYHGYVDPARLVEHYTKRARRLFPKWEADLVPVTVSLVSRDAAKAIGMDIREPTHFLHDALPRARRHLDRFDHRVLHRSPNLALERSGEAPAAQSGRSTHEPPSSGRYRVRSFWTPC